jgi:hypothetical protein
MIIEVDNFKSKIPGYKPTKAEEFHKESGKLADGEFIKRIKEPEHKRIVFMAGGTASGKSEFAYTYLSHKDQLVYDGTLKSYHGFKVKNDKLKKYAKHKTKVKVILILPLHWEDALDVFLTRERKMRLSVFFETHALSSKTVSEIFRETDYRVEVFISSFNTKRNRMVYQRINFKGASRKQKAKIFFRIYERIITIAKKYRIEI